MSGPILLYGASGYSGRLVARELVARGVRPVLCGRDAAKLAVLAATLGLEHRVARADDPSAIARAIGEAEVVVNAAGPFAHTALPIAHRMCRIYLRKDTPREHAAAVGAALDTLVGPGGEDDMTNM